MIGTMNIWIDNWQEAYQTFFRKMSTYNKVCILGNTEAEPNRLGGLHENFNTLLTLCNSFGKDLTIMTSAHKDDAHLYTFPEANINLHVDYWPTFWLMFTYLRLCNGEPLSVNTANGLSIDDYNVGLNYEFDYAFISMNGVPKLHRCLMQDILSEQDLLKHGKYSWRNLRNSGHWYNFKHWNEHQIFLDQSDPNTLFHQEIIPPVYKNCFMQLVPETHEDRFFLTEKTSIPLFFNKPFLVAGSQYFHQRLNGLGFKSYDEIFDYSFDSEPDLEKRYRMLSEQIKRWTNKSREEWTKAYKLVFDKCVYNKALAIKYVFDESNYPSIWKELATPEYDHLQHVNPYHLNKFLNVKRNDIKFLKI